MNFIIKVIKVTGFYASILDRQVTEKVNIENFQGPVLINRRNDTSTLAAEEHSGHHIGTAESIIGKQGRKGKKRKH